MNIQSQQFLEAFIAIEQHLAYLSGLPRGTPFTQQVDTLRQRNQAVRAYAEDLKAFARLRNVIVHERGGGQILAEPNAWAVNRITVLRDLLLTPPTVRQFIRTKVVSIDSKQSLTTAIRLMSNQHFSQLPVYHKMQYHGILSVRNVTYFLGAQPQHVIDLDTYTVADVLTHAAQRDTAVFVAQKTPLIDVLAHFATHNRRGTYLDAVLVTQDGDTQQPLLGLIAAADIPAMNERLQLYSN